jgi:hypothetical protein
MGSERASAFREMNNFLHKAIYDLLTVHRDCSDKYRGLKTLKAKIIRLHAQHYRSMTRDTGEQDSYKKEEPSLFHLLREAKRRKQRTVHQIKIPESGTVHISQEILKAFRNHFTTKYATITIDQDCKQELLKHVTKRMPTGANEAFECPITQGEIQYSIQQEKSRKAPGPDGIAHEFYQTFWDVINLTYWTL